MVRTTDYDSALSPVVNYCEMFPADAVTCAGMSLADRV